MTLLQPSQLCWNVPLNHFILLLDGKTRTPPTAFGAEHNEHIVVFRYLKANSYTAYPSVYLSTTLTSHTFIVQPLNRRTLNIYALRFGELLCGVIDKASIGNASLGILVRTLYDNDNMRNALPFLRIACNGLFFYACASYVLILLSLYEIYLCSVIHFSSYCRHNTPQFNLTLHSCPVLSFHHITLNIIPFNSTST